MKNKSYDRACAGCVYFGWVSYMGCCNYFLKTGKRRPCPPGKDCTVKQKRKKARRAEDD